MILFLHGEDSFRSRHKLNEIVTRFEKSDSSGMNLVTLDMEEKNFADFSKVVTAMPFMGGKRLVIVKNLLSGANKDTQEAVAKILDDKKIPEETTAVFFENKKLDRRKKMFKLLNKLKVSQEFKPLPEYKVGDWIKGEIKQRGSTIEPDAVQRLASYIGNDLWMLNNELTKLSLYRKDKTIRAEDVELLVKAKLDEEIFHLVDAIGDRDIKTSLKLLHDQFEQGENEIKLLGMIAYQFRNLAQIQPLVAEGMPPAEIKRETGLHPFVISKTVNQVRHFSSQKIKTVYDMLVRTDLAMKTSKLDKKTALDLLVVGLCK